MVKKIILISVFAFVGVVMTAPASNACRLSGGALLCFSDPDFSATVDRHPTFPSAVTVRLHSSSTTLRCCPPGSLGNKGCQDHITSRVSNIELDVVELGNNKCTGNVCQFKLRDVVVVQDVALFLQDAICAPHIIRIVGSEDGFPVYELFFTSMTFEIKGYINPNVTKGILKIQDHCTASSPCEQYWGGFVTFDPLFSNFDQLPMSGNFPGVTTPVCSNLDDDDTNDCTGSLPTT